MNGVNSSVNQGLSGAEGSDLPVSKTDGGADLGRRGASHPPTSSLEENWTEAITKCSGVHDSPSDPCWEYLQRKGIAKDGGSDKPTLTTECVPLKGQRWYLSLVMSGVRGEFLVDTGASHTLIDRKFMARLSSQPEAPLQGVRAVTATGDSMQTYGRTVKSMTVDGKTYWICPTITDITDDGIIGMDFAALYGVTMTASTGRLRIQNPYKQSVQCVLRGGVSVASVAQTTNLAAGHITDVLVCSVGVQGHRPGMFEPSDPKLAKLGVAGYHTYLENARWGVIPFCNSSTEVITLRKGEEVGETSRAFGVNSLTDDFVQVGMVTGDSSKEEILTHSRLPKHLMSLVADSHLPSEDTHEVAEKLSELSDAFSQPGEPLGRTDTVQHRVDTGDALPSRIPYRRLPMSKKVAMEAEVEKMLEEDVIQPSESPWSSPVVMVTKKDGSCRFCIDYRKLNGLTRKNAYPLPRIDECVESLGGAKWFCTLDLQSGYWQIGMDPNHREKTAFSTHMGLFEFNVMPFGLCNAPATFEAMMETMLRGLLWKKCLVYLDDIIVFGSSVEDTLQNLQAVLKRILSYGLKLKPSKCKLFRKSVEYLGRIVSENGIMADPRKIEVVQNWPRPMDTKEIRSFIGFCSYYRDFIPGFSKVAAPLQELMIGEKKAKAKIVWSPAAEQSFKELKRLFKETPVLHYPAPVGKFILDTDASNTSIGAALSQIQDGREVPLAFSSNSLSKTQRNYCTTKRELLAVVVYSKKYRHFLYGGDYLVRTDHSSLQWLLNFKDAEGMMGRWLNHLSEFGMTNDHIIHRSGVDHVNADSLSRYPIRNCHRVDCEDCGSHNAVIASVGAHVPNWTLNHLREEQLADSAISRVYSLKLMGLSKPVRPALSLECKEVRQLLAQWDDLFIMKSVLCRWRTQPGKRRVAQSVVPMSLRLQLLNYCHGHRTSAHFGRQRTEAKIKSRYYWPGMTSDIRRWVKECPQCCLSKPGPGLGKLPLSQELFGVRFARIAVDIISGFTTTPRGNTCMMVVQDYYTKYVQVYPLPNHTAVTCAEALFENWILTWGGPLMLHSDQGREFESRLWAEMCERTFICKTHTNPYRPQSDGLVERFNRTLIQCLTTMVNKHRDDWDEHARYITHAYNATEHASTGCTPNMLVMGEDIVMPSDMVYGVQGHQLETPCTVMFVEALRHSLRDSYGVVRDNLEKSASLQKVGYDTGLKNRLFKVGDKVARFSTPNSKIKTLYSWDGPHTVTTVVSETTVIIRLLKGTLTKCHVAKLRPWCGVPRDDINDPSGTRTIPTVTVPHGRPAGQLPTVPPVPSVQMVTKVPSVPSVTRPVKRRGRPRKVQSETQPGNPTPKPKRGRPRKTATTSKGEGARRTVTTKQKPAGRCDVDLPAVGVRRSARVRDKMVNS